MLVVVLCSNIRSIIHKHKEAFNYMTIKEKPEGNNDNSACRFDRTTKRRKGHGG